MDETHDGRAGRTIGDAMEVVRRYAAEHFPNAQVVLLAGSWARGEAHADSDLDVVAIDDTVDRVLFEGTEYEGWIVEACVINPRHAEDFLRGSATYRSAPIPYQIAESVLTMGDRSIADRICALAVSTLACGPEPAPDAERLEMRYDLTLLRDDLAHASAETLPALAAYAHVQLSKAIIDAKTFWRAERKALRRVVMELDPGLARRLADALAEAVHGDAALMLEACDTVLAMLGGTQRTYERFTA